MKTKESDGDCVETISPSKMMVRVQSLEKEKKTKVKIVSPSKYDGGEALDTVVDSQYRRKMTQDHYADLDGPINNKMFF